MNYQPRTNFTHLHLHTQYSLLDGLSKNKDIIAACKKYGMDSIAITDHGAMYGVIHFYNDLKEAGLKPIIGCEVYYTSGSRHDKSKSHPTYHLLLLAKNMAGYRHLIKLVSLAHLEGFYYKPRIDWEILQQYHQGLIATTGCLHGEIPQLIRQGNLDQAETRLKDYLKIFGDDFYIELQRHENIPELEPVNQELIKFSRKLGIPLVATNDVHYVYPEDAQAQDALLAIGTRTTLDNKNRLTMLDSPSFYLKSPQEMSDLFADLPEAIANTQKIADKCNLEIPTGKMIFPHFPLPSGYDAKTYLRQMVYDRLPRRYPQADQTIKNRIDYELDIISSKGYASYFLIVQDFVNWAKQQGIGVGPGRGSAAGSIVSYILGITEIDPLQHNLPFERFMNPQRPSPPDIDIDIADTGRDKVIDYVAHRYGQDKVAQVITFGTMEARAAVRDIGRVLGMPYSEPDKIAKLIPMGYSIKQALTEILELQEIYKNPKYKELLDLAQKVEGSARHASTHAAAVIIADKDLTHYTPIQRESKHGNITTQYDMYALDLNVNPKAIGLLKMDFLGLRNLTILQKAINLIKKTQGKKININQIPLDDKKVYQMIATGETTGIFQLESAGMRRVAKQLQPSRFSDLVAMVALYRPGPMTLIPEFIQGKKDPSQIKYPHPDLKPILEETYGIIVYQEQVLEIAHVMAGYSLGEADILRRAIGKKKKSIMDKQKKRFIQQAQEKGYSRKTAENVWAFIERFASYGFNKAHSASYAMIAYQTAYLKTNYPVEYMTALMSAESGKEEKIALSLEECRRMGIKVLPPDINHSQADFTLEADSQSLSGQAIRFGLSAIKNVGTAAIENILKERIMGGEFKSFTDFLSRTDGQKINKKVLESLIKVGAFDRFGKRSVLLAEMDRLRQLIAKTQAQKNSNQASLFDSLAEEADFTTDNFLVDKAEFSQEELLQMEKELLGIYLREHPLHAKLKQLRTDTATKIADLSTKSGLKTTVYAIIDSLRPILTKAKKNPMAFLTLVDETGKVDAVIFPKLYAQVKDLLVVGELVVVKAKVDIREDKISLIIDSLERPQTQPSPVDQPTTNTIIIPRKTSKKALLLLNQLLQQNKGDDQITLLFQNGDGSPGRKLVLPFGIRYTAKLQEQIKNILSTN